MDQIKHVLTENTKPLDPIAKKVPPFIDIARSADVNPGLVMALALGLFTIIVMLF